MNQVKAVITKDTKTFKDDKVLHLLFDGDHYEEIKNYLRLRKVGPGSVILFKIDDRESKSYKQLKTIHLLLRIYMNSDLSGAESIEHLKNRVKYQYGVIDYWEAADGQVIASLKSFADYKMSELAEVITGLFDEMIKVFAESGYNDKRLDSMVQEFNSQKITADEEMELF